jgi:hypothetical protein
LSEEVVNLLLACRPGNRRLLQTYFGTLAADPQQRGDFIERDAVGRELQVKRFSRWLVTFWSDDPVKELRIVRVEPV